MPKVTAREAVRVEGLNDLLAGLKIVGPEAVRELGKANKEAAEFIADDARKRATDEGGVAAKSAASIKSSAAAKQASVSIGSDAYPFALGAEFGAKKYHQFKPWRGNQWVESGDADVGYFLHPAIRDGIPQIEERYLKAIDGLSKQAFPD